MWTRNFCKTDVFETVEAEIKEIDGTQISVATPSALYKLKKGAIREFTTTRLQIRSRVDKMIE